MSDDSGGPGSGERPIYWLEQAPMGVHYVTGLSAGPSRSGRAGEAGGFGGER